MKNIDFTHSCIGHVKYSTSGKSTKNNKLNFTGNTRVTTITRKKYKW